VPIVAGQGKANGRSHSTSTNRRPSGRPGPQSIAACQAQGRPVVIDFGTATTFDAVDFSRRTKGHHCPGINLSLTLVGAAAKLPRIAIPRRGQKRHRTDTETDADWRLLGLCGDARCSGRMRAEIGRPVTVIATGGLAILFDKHTDV
jgi:type III pantothenate kinase